MRPADTPPPATDAGYLAQLTALTHPFGVTHTGVAPATVLHRARTAIQQRLDDGLVDGMQFTFKNPERSTDPRQAVANAWIVAVEWHDFAIKNRAFCAIWMCARSHFFMKFCEKSSAARYFTAQARKSNHAPINGVACPENVQAAGRRRVAPWH